MSSVPENQLTPYKVARFLDANPVVCFDNHEIVTALQLSMLPTVMNSVLRRLLEAEAIYIAQKRVVDKHLRHFYASNGNAESIYARERALSSKNQDKRYRGPSNAVRRPVAKETIKEIVNSNLLYAFRGQH